MENVSAPGGGRSSFPRAIVVGRDPELNLLADLAAESLAEGAQIVFVSGEAGIGKSTLVRHFLDQLGQQGWAIHVGQCIEYSERTVPFGPVVGLIRSIIDQLDDADAVLAPHRADLAALVPEVRADGVAGDSLTGDVDRLIDAISSVLVHAAHEQPIALFIEDIHWADGSTRDVVASLIHALGTAPVIVVVSERSGAVPRGHQLRTWLAEQQRFPNVHTMPLVGLSPDALAEQATNILGEAPSAELLDELARRTGGNAYFSNELLEARRSGSRDLPSSLADFLTTRIEHLTSPQQEILRAVAVAGGAISHRLLTAALPDLDPGPSLRELFDNAVIVHENGEYGFAHALMREAMLRSVLPFEVEELHRRLAEALVADPSRGRSLADLTALAMHWKGANDLDQALMASIAASHAAAGVAAYEAAVELATDAIDLWDRVPSAVEKTGITKDALALDAADWLAASNDITQASELLEQTVQSSGDTLTPARRALLLANLGPLRFVSGKPDEANALLDQAAVLIGDEISPEAAQVHLNIARLSLRRADVHAARAAAQRAIDIATEVGPASILPEALSSRALCVGVSESLEKGVELIGEARRLALSMNLVSQVALTYRREMMIINFRHGRTQRSLDVLREAIEFANARCGPKLRHELATDLALGLVEDGSLVEAAPLLGQITAQPGQLFLDLTTLHTTTLSRLLAGDLDGAAETLESTNDLAPRFTQQELGLNHRLRAELARRRGDFDAAIALIDAALESQFATDNITFTRESVIEKCRLVVDIAAVDRARGQQLKSETEALIDRLAADSTSGLVTELGNLLLSQVDGEARADDARDLADRLEQGGFGADAKQTRLLHARLLAEERPGSQELASALADLRSLAQTSGMRWLGDVADELSDQTPTIDLTEPSVLDITANDSSDHAAVGIDDHGLTPREIEVLGMLARGLTNKEIGAELYVSHRTISTHVSNLLSKLHLKSRSEAASKYHELGFAKLQA